MTFDDCKTPMDAAEKITKEEWVWLPRNITTAIQHFCNRTLEQQRAGTVPHMADDVREFMAMAGQPLPTKPGWPSDEVMDLAVRMKAEEFLEWIKAIGYEGNMRITRYWAYQTLEIYRAHHEVGEPKRDLAEAVDALIDDLYVTIGRLLDLGVDPTPLWSEVHAANMRKRGGPVVDSKLKKPAGWRPPDIEARLREQGWDLEEGM